MTEAEIRIALRRAARNFITGKYTLARLVFKGYEGNSCYCAFGGFAQASIELGYVNSSPGSLGSMTSPLFAFMEQRNMKTHINGVNENALLWYNDEIANNAEEVGMALALLSVAP